MLLFVYVAVLIAGCAVASPQANQYYDNILNSALQTQLRSLSLDPAAVPNFNVSFYDTIKIIGKVKGNANFTNGNVTGLSLVRRFSESQGPAYSFGRKYVNGTIVFNNLKIQYQGKMKYGQMPAVNIKAKANVTTTTVFTEISTNSAPGFQQATVSKFNFQNVGTLNTEFTGLGPLNRFMKFLEDGFKQHAQAHIFNSFSERFLYALNRAVATVPLPN